MNKPAFNPNKPFSPGAKPAFDSSKPFDAPHKLGLMDVLPQMIGAVSEMGAPNMGIQMVGDAIGDNTPSKNIDPQRDTAGLQDVSIPDAVTAAGLASSVAKPMAEWASPQLGRLARNQTMKGMGGSISQIKQMAKKGGLDKAAEFANENGLNDVFSTSLGREQHLEELEKGVGSKIGELRDAGSQTASPIGHNALDPQIMGNPRMAKYLGNGLESGQAGDIPKALEDVKRISGNSPTFSSRADAATELNKSAAGTKLYQPTSATTDVANTLSQSNNEGLRAALGPDKAAEYDASLSDYHSIEPLKHLQEHGELKEMRPGGGSLYHDVKGAIAGGWNYRLGGQAGYGMKGVTDAVGTAASKVPGTIGGVTANLMSRLSSNPQSLGQYAAPLLKAAQEGGNQGLAATHYILSTSHPKYNMLINGDQEDPSSAE